MHLDYYNCGNHLQKSSPNGAEWFHYNGFDQLTLQKNATVMTGYGYNASGIRTTKQTESSKTYFLLDGGNVVAEYANGEQVAHYVWGINLIRRKFGSNVRYYLFNAHGDVVCVTNGSGGVIKYYDYDAFGNEKKYSASDKNPFRYCGEYFDKETGTYYLRARYYDPAIGRFTQQDPIKYGLNWYAYCSNNPINRIDPSGKKDFIYTSKDNCYIENDWGDWDFLHPDRYFIEFNGKRYSVLSLETIKLYNWDSIDENFLEETFHSLVNTANQKKDEPWDWVARWAGVTYFYTSTGQESLYINRYCQYPVFFW